MKRLGSKGKPHYNRIKELNVRNNRVWHTNKHLAKVLGRDKITIGRILLNQSQPNVADISRFAELLECEPSELLNTIKETKSKLKAEQKELAN